jgi:UDP-N-acetylglucosamine acyltransferase
MARVDKGARLADDVEIGPFCFVGPDVELRAGVRLVSHVSISGVTAIGERTVIHPFASLGSPPQSVSYRGGPTRLEVGADCIIRESVTMSTGTEDGRGVTSVGDRGFFMAYSHIGHDCQVGNDVVFANGATLGGHCTVGEHVVIGGLSPVHQFIRIGAHAMIGGLTGVRRDVIPFALASGPDGHLFGINLVGMRRRKFSAESIKSTRDAYRRLFYGEGNFDARVATVEREFSADAAVAQILAFIRADRKRAIAHPRGQEAADAE